MKKIVTIIGLCFTTILSVNASLVLTQNSGYSYSSGGEFRAVTTTESFLQNYSVNAILNGGFETFCVESTVHFIPGVSYDYTLSQIDSQGRQLTLGTAYLYSQFASGNLNGYSYGANRTTSAAQLQSAIWYLQGGQTVDGFLIPNSINNPFYALALNMFGDNVLNPNNGTYNVSFICLWDSYHNPAQNQLVVTGAVPEPSTIVAGVLILLPFGISTMKVIRRKQIK